MGANSKSKKRKPVETMDSDEDAGIYTVELILKARVASTRKRKWVRSTIVHVQLELKCIDEDQEYYVKWAGYDSDSNTWEPESNLSQCERLLGSFWEGVGMDWEDYPEGYECKPDPKWIAMEKRRFWQEITPAERNRYSKQEEQRRKETQRRRALEGIIENSPEPSPSPPPMEVKSASTTRRQQKKPTKRPRVTISSSGSDHGSNSDLPLAQEKKLKLRIPAKRQHVESPTTSDGEPLSLQAKRKTKISKTYIRDQESADRLIRTNTPVQQSTDKGKGKEAAEEAPPDSPSSLFSTEAASEVVVVSRKPQPETRPASERKPSGSFSIRPSLSSAKTSPAVPPKLLYRLTNPHTKLIEGSSSLAALTSGIPIKQKLAHTALAPVNPKELQSRSTSFKRVLHPLRFKKNSVSGNTVLVPDESTIESPTLQSPDLTLNALNTVSPTDYSSTLPDSFSTLPPFGIESPQGDSRWMSSSTAESAVNDFLSSMTKTMPGPTVELTFEPKPPPPLTARKSTVIPGKIPKKWKWEGKLFVLRAGGEEDPIGTVVCTNTTNPKPRGMRIPLTFESMDHLNFISFHDASDVPVFLEACKSADQFATLSALDSEAVSPFKTIVDYMTKHEKVVLVPVWYENNLVGHLLIFPPALHGLINQLEVPPEITTHATDSLVVSLHGWVLNPAVYKEESRLPLSDIIPSRLSPGLDNHKRAVDGQPGPRFGWMSSLRRNVVFHFALQALKFPPDLYEWLTTNFRQYAIYHDFEKADDRSEHIEHEMLKKILDACQAQEWKHDLKKQSRLRVVFVHVGSIRNFHRSPLTQKRISLDIRFCTYGTDGDMPRHMWGVREIYPIGGIVTFTPSAFVENYVGTIRLIQRIHEHPLWMAFITPSCLGYLINSAYGGQDPLATYNKKGKIFVYQKLLTAITEGELAFLTAPGESMTPVENVKSWVHDYCGTTNPLGVLSSGVTAFNSLCANAPQGDWMRVVQQNISQNIVAFQRHPAILYDYRRFIIVKSEGDTMTTPLSVEDVTPSHFSFQDDYFKQKG